MKRLIGIVLFTAFSLTVLAQEPELRGYWADSFHAGYKTTTEANTLISRAKTSKANALFPQVRARADAYYVSSFENWSTNFPNPYDALAYLIQQAHAQNPPLQVHAWMNAHTLWATQTPPSDPNHLVNKHPEWLTKNNSGSNYITDLGYGMDFGHPNGADWTARVYMDVVRNYNVDGIHYDYIRYAGNTWGYNDTSLARFRARYNVTGTPAPNDDLFEQWRRDQVTALVRKVWLNTMALKPNVRVSAACIPWGNGPTTENGWLSSSAYLSVFQNWRDWLAEGILDTAIPMCYFDDAQYPNYYRNWANFIKDHQYNRSAAIGLGNYLNTVEQTKTQIDVARAISATNNSFPSTNNKAIGINFYSYAGTNDNGATGGGTINWYNSAFYTEMGAKLGANIAVPDMPWKTPASGNGHIRGAIVLASNTAWADSANVILTGPGIYRTQIADGTGYFGFVDLPTGLYRIQIFYNGALQKTVNDIIVAAGQVATVNALIGNTSGAVEVESLKDLKGLASGTLVVMKDKIVQSETGHFADRIYVADWENGSGIAVKEPIQAEVPWQIGDIVAIRGTLAIDANGERVIHNATVQMMGFEWGRKPRTISLRMANSNAP